VTEAVQAAGELPLPLVRRGKVRELYGVDAERLLMVASDRISAFDVIMAEPIPGKGQVLTALSAFWFRFTTDLVRNHLLSDDPRDLPAAIDPTAIEGRWLLVRRAARLDVECVVRGYLAGSGWAEYRRHGTVAEEPLPPGLVESSQLPEPIFTPAIKADSGHDENISRARLAELVGAAQAHALEQTSLALYRAGAAHAASRGVILADTKFEFGLVDGALMLIDEALTPDSSRYWPANAYAPGGPQPSFDKQFLRDFLEQSGWNKEPPPPALPPAVLDGTAARYREALTRLTA
jgi:phosphoribosylaminoimidazole-succinocarboxamide synthase